MKTKIVLLLGATGFVGRHLAEYLVSIGYEVLIHGRNEKKLTSLAKKIGDGCVGSIVFDFRSESFNNFKINSKIYAIVNTAAIPGEINKFDRKDWQEVFLVNTIAPFGLISRLKGNIINGGRIILFSSALVRSINHSGYIGQDAYILSKSSISNLAILLIKQMHGKVRVNVIAPSYIQNSSFRTNKIYDSTNHAIIKRNCSINDINGLAKFLLSSESDYLTGEIFYLDGKRQY